MRRPGRFVVWLLGTLLLVPLVLIAVLVIALNIDPGRAEAARLIARATGGSVVVTGISGSFPTHFRVQRIELRDEQGVWAVANAVVLDWRPARLLRGVAWIDRLQVAELELPRLPEATAGSTPAPPSQRAKPFSLPVAVHADTVEVARAEIGAPVIGTPASLGIAGSLDLPSLGTLTTRLQAHRLDGDGQYTLEADINPTRIGAKVAVSEAAGGLIAHFSGLPDVGALRIQADVTGPRTALDSTVALTAGALRADAHGVVDLSGQSADFELTGSAPPMSPAPDVAWQGIAVNARVHGPWTAPDASGRLQVDALRAGGAEIGRLTADLDGNAGRVSLRAVAEGLRVPGPQPDLFAPGNLTVDATVRLDDPARPATFTIAHPLVSVTGEARTAGAREVTARITVPRLAPLAAVGGIVLQGSTDFRVRGSLDGTATRIEADGTVSIAGGLVPVPAVVGETATVGITAEFSGADFALSRLDVTGKGVTVQAQVSRRGGSVDGRLRLGLPNLTALAPNLTGAVQADVTAQGTADDLGLRGSVDGDIGAPGVPRGRVKLRFALQGLPGAPSGSVEGEGTLAGSPLALAVEASRAADGTVLTSIKRASWRSLQAEGALRLPPGAVLPLGQVSLRMHRLDDLRPFVGQPVAGSVAATAELERDSVRLRAQLQGVGVGANRVGRATIEATVSDPLRRRVVAATADLAGIDASGTTGSARIEVNGPQDALALRTTASLILSGTPAQIAGTAMLNVPAQSVQLRTLQVTARDETARLLAPATIRFSPEVAVDRLRVGLRQAVLDVSGTLSPRLNATATLRAPADIVAIVRPDLAMNGSVTADARLTGTPAQPGGTLRLTASGLRLRTGPGSSIPPANVQATVQLLGQAARIDARVAAGSARLAAAGQVPLGAGALDVRATGSLDLTLLDPILTAAGRQVRGRLTLDGTATGSLAAPRLAGTAQLAGAEVQDFVQGLRVSNIAGSMRAEGDTLRITRLTGRAGPGTLAVSGSIGVLAPGMPIDLAVNASNARPLSSDLLTANLDANLTVRGQVQGTMQAAGRVLIRQAEIRVPERLPPTVAALEVIRPGSTRRGPPPGPAPEVNLNLVVDAPERIFVWGRGIDAELSGQLRISGDASHPQVSGGLDMRRGTLSAAGTTLTFSRGKVGFAGTGVSGKIDPTLDFIAENTANSVTATLAITGFASAPKIKLTSVPDLPQDEVLSYLLFRRSVKDLGPFQIASIAAALASLTGVGGSGNPLDSVRRGLGLDRLSIGGGTTRSGPTLEAGRYVANGVYVGAKQGTNGGTGATVQIDITKGLKLQTDVGTGTRGNQVGVTYQFEY